MAQPIFDRFYYGGDWNPEQWSEDVWRKDIKMLEDAGINEATINVFSWAQLQPSEDEYDFSTLDRIVKLLVDHHFGIVLATSTAAIPAWMARRHPDVMYTDFNGVRHKFGDRHNPCPNSPTFRKYAPKLAGKLAERYADTPGLVAWHVSNEYGAYCYCDNCREAWIEWLKAKYGTVEALNKAWYSHFWGHTIYDWDDIVVPNALSDEWTPGCATLSAAAIDYRRFMSRSITRCFTDEKAAIRQFDTKTPITTNLMSVFMDIDYFDLGKELDVISWDSYPRYDFPASAVAMRHDLMRGVGGGKPYMLMEQTPSQQNWQPYNSLKRPGQMRVMSYQAIAHGADTVQFFQLRRSIGGTERFHGAVISHADTENTRVFREVSQLGAELKTYGKEYMGGSVESQAAIMFDWERYWAMYYSSGPSVLLKYVDEVHRYYAALYRRNVQVDMIPSTTPADQLAKYKVVLAPALIMVKPGVAEAVESYVRGGGRFVATTMSGIADENDQVFLGGYPGAFRELVGSWGEEIDALPPERPVSVRLEDGREVSGSIVAELIHPVSSRVLASYASDFYAGMAAATVNEAGEGKAYYVGTDLDEAGMDWLADVLVRDSGLDTVETPHDVEVRVRDYDDGRRLVFVLNNGGDTQTVDLPERLSGTSVFDGKRLAGLFDIEPYGLRVIRVR